jgi:phenylacetic acid degradation protein PaaD
VNPPSRSRARALPTGPHDLPARAAADGADEHPATATDARELIAAQLLASDEVARALGIELSEVRAGHAVATMRVATHMLNGHGIVHGGYLFLLADTAFAFASLDERGPAVSRRAEITFVSPGRPGECLRAIAEQRPDVGRPGSFDVTVSGTDGAVRAEFRGQSAVLRGELREDGPPDRIDAAETIVEAADATPPRLEAAMIERLVAEAVAEIDPAADLSAMAVGFNLFRVANRIQQDLETGVHRPSGITWAAFRILFTVRYAKQITPLELARLSHVSQASISSVLNTLERYGLVARSRSPSDGRVTIVTLTAAGEAAVGELFRRNNARERAWTAALSVAERDTLTALLRKILSFHPPPANSVGQPIARSRAPGASASTVTR